VRAGVKTIRREKEKNGYLGVARRSNPRGQDGQPFALYANLYGMILRAAVVRWRVRQRVLVAGSSVTLEYNSSIAGFQAVVDSPPCVSVLQAVRISG